MDQVASGENKRLRATGFEYERGTGQSRPVMVKHNLFSSSPPASAVLHVLNCQIATLYFLLDRAVSDVHDPLLEPLDDHVSQSGSVQLSRHTGY